MAYLTFGPQLVILIGKFKEVLKFAKEQIIKTNSDPRSKIIIELQLVPKRPK